MAISRNIVNLMNGNIKVDSTLHKGTRITVTIYLELQEKEKEQDINLMNLPVLVVDDDRTCCESTVATLKEIGINTNFTRHYAHAVHGKRAIDATPINTPAGTTVLSSIRLNGSLVYTTYQGGTTAERFCEYMKEQLIPSLEKDDVVIMDNMRSHHAKIVTKLLDKAGISYMYLPPYSPDLNPIEKMWSKMKSILRKRKIRIASELPEAVKAALGAVSTNDCKGWFRSCGICTN